MGKIRKRKVDPIQLVFYVRCADPLYNLGDNFLITIKYTINSKLVKVDLI